MKKLISIIKKIGEKAAVCCIAGTMAVGVISCLLTWVFAGEVEQTATEPAVIRLGKVEVYSAKKGETMITVPILADGTMDFDCYDLTIRYDSELLDVQKDSTLTGMTAFESHQQVVTEEKGIVRMAGVLTKEPTWKEGQIGQITFLLKERIRQDGVTSVVGLDVNELGFDTEASDVLEGQGVIVLHKSQAPDPTLAPVSYYYGDVNKDGEIGASDALAILKYVVKLPTDATEFDTTDAAAMELADINADGNIAAGDALGVLKVVVKLEEKKAYDGVETVDPIVTKAPEETTEEPAVTQLPLETAEPSKWSEPVTVKKGDLTEDGVYSVRDGLVVYQILTGEKEADETMSVDGDVNADGEVTEKDVDLLVQAAVGKYTSFGYEKPIEDNVIYVDCKTLTTGDYCYRTLQEAVSYLNKNAPDSEEERITVRIAPGTYREHTILNAPYVTYEGMYPEKEMPIITYYYGCGMQYHSLSSSASADNASTVISRYAHDFIAKNLMFENSYNIYVSEEERTDYAEENFPTLEQREANIREKNYQTQGLALRVDADRSQFINCQIIGRQDTLLMNNSNRCYYEECYIEGTVDFIYGSGIAVFESCTINSPYHNGHITAASTPAEQPFGFLFKDCVLTKEAVTEDPAPIPESYSLGRPWNGPAMVIYYNCRMDDHIATRHTDEDRFVTMRETFPKEEARFGECGTMDINGNPFDLSDICPDYEMILTEENMATTYSPYIWLSSKFNTSSNQLEYDGWNPGHYSPVVVE